MKHSPFIDHISGSLVRAFSFMVSHPDDWFAVEQLVQATDVSKATLYRRFGNLVAAGVLSARQMDGFRQFKLHPRWRECRLGADLFQRSVRPS